MVLSGERLADADYAQLARLQVQLLPGSRVSRMGPAAAEAFWRFAAGSALERVAVERRDARIVGAGLLSTSPRTLSARLLRSRFLLHVLAHPAAALRSAGEGGATGEGCELVMLCVESGHRRAGIARRILAALEDRLRDEGIGEYAACTEDEPGAALAFYAACGFERRGEFRRGGARYARLARRLPS